MNVNLRKYLLIHKIVKIKITLLQLKRKKSKEM